MKYTGRRRREARREGGGVLPQAGGGCRVPGAGCTGWPRARRPSPAARSTPPSPSAPPRSSPSWSCQRLRCLFLAPQQRQRRRGGGRACRPVGAATVFAGVRPRRGAPCAAPPGGGPGAPALPVPPTARHLAPPDPSRSSGSDSAMMWAMDLWISQRAAAARRGRSTRATRPRQPCHDQRRRPAPR